MEWAVCATDDRPSLSPGHTTASTNATQSSGPVCLEALQREKGERIQYFFFFSLPSLTVTVPKNLS